MLAKQIPVVIGTLINYNASQPYDNNNEQHVERIERTEAALYAILESGNIEQLNDDLLFHLIVNYSSSVGKYDFVADLLIEFINKDW